MTSFIKVAIAGVQGYSGQELLSLVQRHPYAQLVGVLTRPGAARIPFLPDSVPCFSIEAVHEHAIDVLFLATPPEASMELVTQLKDPMPQVIDLSGAFRFTDQQEFEKTYGIGHLAPELSAQAYYGLSPLLPMPQQKPAIIANPGCYATCAVMALAPLLQAGLVDPQSIVIDAKSGASGAGKKMAQALMFCEMEQNFFPYKIGQHRHVPEMRNALAAFSGESCQITFVPQVLPMIRGMSAALYLTARVKLSREQLLQAIEKAYAQTYQDYPLLEFSEINESNSAKNAWLLSVKSVVNSPKVHIAYYVDHSGRIIIFSAIDNLLKGAASQAIENFNRLYDWPVALGLMEVL